MIVTQRAAKVSAQAATKRTPRQNPAYRLTRYFY
jgi:hypothetical protein